MQSEEKRIVTTEESIIADEIAAIDRQLNELANSRDNQPVPKKPSSKIDLSEVIGVANNKTVENEEPLFLTPKQIKAVKRDLSQIVPSGIDLMDKRIIGFSKSELCVWSGSNGSGKSSILSQLAINSINNGFKVAFFSGELMADRVLNWIQLQCVGKNHVESTQYENYYTVPSKTKEKINNWLEGDLFIYNNNFGSKVENVLKAIDGCINKNEIDVVIIDNMMSLDLASVNGEKYDRQTNLVSALSQLAKKKNVVIHFVCHPRKSLGFLRKQDISGTADITNLADNVFIVHRCNTDFKRSIKEFLQIKEDNPLLRYSNIIEIAKNRSLGVADEFIGTFFEKESKRFLNSLGEDKHYKWEFDKEGFTDCINEEYIPFKE